MPQPAERGSNMGLFKKLIKKSPVGKVLSKSPGMKMAAKIGDPLAKAVTGSGSKRASRQSPPPPGATQSVGTGGNGSRRQVAAASTQRMNAPTKPLAVGSNSGVGRLQKFNSGSGRGARTRLK